MKTIELDEDIVRYLASKASAPGEPLGNVLRRELRVPQPPTTVEIDDDLYGYLISRTADLGESASRVLRRELRLPVAAPPAPDHEHRDPTIVEFHIPPNTGGTAWNTQAEMVRAIVGDTLRIVNDDAVAHRLHTDGVPFSHPADSISPGQSAQFALQAPFDPIAATPLYDHNFGTGAAFWITVTIP